MPDRPILFSAPMVRAILEGRKTQTRRAVKPQPANQPELGGWGNLWFATDWEQACRYGKPGDRLWVREAIRLVPDQQPDDGTGPVLSTYAADGSPTAADAWPWMRSYLPPMHCPRGLSRIILEVTGVRVERLQDISEADAIAEGLLRDKDGWRGAPDLPWFASPVAAYRSLWESINGSGSWDANPWVWVVEFRRIEQEAQAA